MARLQTEPIEVEPLTASIRSDEDGAVTLFVGTVRNHHGGRRVIRLEYHAYPEMAERELARVEREARRRYEISDIVIVHRTGTLEIGEASVVVAVASPHRAAALDACRFAIETLKKTVPIWKKELFEGGSVWIEGSGTSPAES